MSFSYHILPSISDVVLIVIAVLLFAVYQKVSLIASRLLSAPSKPTPPAAIPEISQNEIEVESGPELFGMLDAGTLSD
jgi:hypothetical protein